MTTRTTIRWVVLLTAIGSLMAAVDTLVVSTALSRIRLDLNASVGQLEWSVSAYNLSFAVLLITAAALGDRYGRRRLFATGLGLFALGLALLSAAFPPQKRGAAIGIFSAVTGIAVAAGPLLGGAVVQGPDWHWIFWINVPIGLATIPFVLTKMEPREGPAGWRSVVSTAAGGEIALWQGKR